MNIMYNLYGKYKVSAEMSKYIKEQTNKWVERHIKNNSLKKSAIEVSNLVKQKYEDTSFSKNSLIMPFLSFISFLAGYKFSMLTNK